MNNKRIVAVIAILCTPVLVFSQVDLKPFVGYNFGASTSYYPGEIKVKGDFTYGAELDFYIDQYT